MGISFGSGFGSNGNAFALQMQQKMQNLSAQKQAQAVQANGAAIAAQQQLNVATQSKKPSFGMIESLKQAVSLNKVTATQANKEANIAKQSTGKLNYLA